MIAAIGFLLLLAFLVVTDFPLILVSTLMKGTNIFSYHHGVADAQAHIRRPTHRAIHTVLGQRYRLPLGCHQPPQLYKGGAPLHLRTKAHQLPPILLRE